MEDDKERQGTVRRERMCVSDRKFRAFWRRRRGKEKEEQEARSSRFQMAQNENNKILNMLAASGFDIEITFCME